MDNKLGFDTGKWEIAGGGAKVTVQLGNGQLLWDMQGTVPGMDIRNGELGRVTAAGQALQWVRLIGADESTDSSGSRTLAITLEEQKRSLRLTQYITVFADRPFVRAWGVLENCGTETVLIEDCDIFLMIPNCQLPLALFHVEQFSAAYRRDYFRPGTVRVIAGRTPHEILMGSYPSQQWGPTSCAWFALLSDKPEWCAEIQPETGDGIVCGIEFNGKSRIRVWAEPETAQLISNIDELAHQLVPGGQFEIPAFFTGRFQGDWDEAGYVTQRFAEAYVHPPMPDSCYPWAQYNSWAYDQDINEAQQLEAIDRCAELGLELAVLDLGWARKIGDWRPDPVKFSRGLKPLVERARSYGMRFGVHVALAQCSLEAPVAKAHPDWLIHSGVDYFGAASFCLGHGPCRNWLIEQLSELVAQEGIDYIIQDGEDMVKRCQHTNHTHAAGDSNYANSQYGLDIVITSLRQAHPHLVIENCEDGGCMMTYKMGRMYHTSITVDNIDTYSTRQGIYGSSYPFSPRYSVRYMQDAPTRYTLYSSIFGGPLILMHRITDWTAEQVQETRLAIQKYKELREVIREAKIIHLKMPRYNNATGGQGWDAIQAVTQDQSKSVVMVYRAGGEDESEKVFRLRGLQPQAVYRLCFDGQDTVYIRTGAELEKEGVAVQLEAFSAEILFLTQANPPETV